MNHNERSEADRRARNAIAVVWLALVFLGVAVSITLADVMSKAGG